jgi:hypothetical protein
MVRSKRREGCGVSRCVSSLCSLSGVPSAERRINHPALYDAVHPIKMMCGVQLVSHKTVPLKHHPWTHLLPKTCRRYRPSRALALDTECWVCVNNASLSVRPEVSIETTTPLCESLTKRRCCFQSRIDAAIFSNRTSAKIRFSYRNTQSSR